MKRREFIEWCIAAATAHVLPANAAGSTYIAPTVSAYKLSKRDSYPYTFAYAISAKLSPKLGAVSVQAKLARFDVVILNLSPLSDARYSGRTWQDVVANIRALNPDILLGVYTILEETKNDSNKKTNWSIDKYTKVQNENWWLRTDSGTKIKAYGETCAINGSRYSAPDASGMRWPQWLAKRNFEKFFNPALITGKGLDIWFFDNVRCKSLYHGDWNKDGLADESSVSTGLSAYRGMNKDYISSMRALAPQLIIMGNAPCDLSAYPKALDASLNEAMFGKTWSLGGYPPWGKGHDGSWAKAMYQYNAQFKNVNTDLVVFQAQGLSTDYQLLRYALCSCLLNNGYFNYADESVGYVVPPWFDEYDHKLGTAITAPQSMAWKNGVWRRDFEFGISLVNPTTSTKTVNIEAGFHRISGVQDPATNSGASAAGKLTIPSRDGIILIRD